jgi:large subunit ribosomal protein L3
MQLTSLLGKKTYQKSGFLENGTRVPLTAVNVMGNFVAQVKSTEKEGYNSIQLGIGDNKKAKKRAVNHSKKAGLTITPRFLKEIRLDDLEGVTLGSELNVAEVFAAGDIIDVTGTSKGKGWAGGVKRYGFAGGPKTHGQSDRHRAPGSIGQGTTPGRVYKGKRMAGRMGSDTVTVKNLEVIEVTSDGLLLIKGLVPGFVGSYVVVKKVGENKKFVPLYKELVDEPVVETAEPEVEVSEPVTESASQDAVEPVVEEEVQAGAVEVAPEETQPVQETPEEASKEVTEEVKEGEANGNS